MEMRNESNSSVLHVFVFVAKKKHMKAKVCLRELKAPRPAMLNRSAPCMRDQKSEMFECY